MSKENSPQSFSLGSEIRKYRKKSGESLNQMAQAIGVKRPYLNKIELGISRPSERVLQLIMEHLSLSDSERNSLLELSGYRPLKLVESETGRKEREVMSDKVSANSPAPTANVTIDPNTRPVLYSESVFISSSDYGLTMDFAQRVGPSDQQFVVSRVGMSFEHAKKMLEVLNDHLQKHER